MPAPKQFLHNVSDAAHAIKTGVDILSVAPAGLQCVRA
jgi:hypothetical protein